MLRPLRTLSSFITLLGLSACTASPAALTKVAFNEDTPADASATDSATRVIPPLANAGPDQEVIRGAMVTLDGRRSFHPQGRALSASWSQTSGTPVVTLANAAQTLTTFIAPARASDLGFTLTVSDDMGTTMQDEVRVHVVDVATRVAPTVLSNGDRVVSPGAETTLGAYLLGGELDVDLEWQQVAGSLTQITASGPYGKALRVLGPDAGFAIYSVEGSFAGMRSAPDFTIVTTPKTEETSLGALLYPPPAATGEQSTSVNESDPTGIQAVTGITGSPGAVVKLNATTREPAASLWTQVLGEPVLLTLEDQKWTFIAPPTPQLLWFAFTPDPTALRTSPLVTSVLIEDASVDGLVANAGLDRGAHPGVTVTLDGSKSSGRETLRYDWTQTLGTQVTLSDRAAAKPTFVAPNASGQDLVFVLTLKGDLGVSRADSVVVTLRAPSDNTPPSGTIEATPVASASFSLRAAFFDRDSDAFSCAWSSATASFDTVSGERVMATLPGGNAAQLHVRCCDELGACGEAERTLP